MELSTGHAGPSSLLYLTVFPFKEKSSQAGFQEQQALTHLSLLAFLMDVNCAVGKSFVFLECSV